MLLDHKLHHIESNIPLLPQFRVWFLELSFAAIEERFLLSDLTL